MTGPRISLLHFSNSKVRGGAEEHILTLLRGLDRARFRIHLVAAPEVAEQLRPDVPTDVELISLCLRKPRQLSAALRLWRIIKERKVDILHSHLFYGSLFASPIARLALVPVILETPHVREHWRRGRFKSHFFVDRLAGRCVDHYIAVSRANARYLVESKGLPQDKIIVITNGCDLQKFDPARQAPSHLKHQLGLDSDNLILMVLGRLEPQKGHRVLLDALPKILAEHPQARLVCVGEGSLRGELEQQARTLHLEGSVHFAGYQSNVADWLALADVTVLPSFYEGLPLVAIESLAAGRPVVATAVDGTPEVVVNEYTGLTVRPGDSRQLSDAINRMLCQPELRRSFARNGRNWVLQHFSETRQVEQTQEFYIRALAQRAGVMRRVLNSVKPVSTQQ